MERKRILLIGVAAAILLVGAVVLLGLRKPRGPDCSLIAKAQTQAGRPVVALAPLLGDDSKGLQAETVVKKMSELVDVARVPSPLPDFSKASVPDAVKQAQESSQVWLGCGAVAAVWGLVEHESDKIIEEKRGKKPVTKPVYVIALWVTTGPDSTIQIPRTRDGREAGEAAFKAWSEKERKNAQSAQEKTQEPGQEEKSAPPAPQKPEEKPADNPEEKPPVQEKP
ncbi:MAG: hypothetical protein HQL44_04675 [Alphaproteobacteria bacterium]|nr:hypothetical protein [Alphaproteobacteria bacterium]